MFLNSGPLVVGVAWMCLWLALYGPCDAFSCWVGMFGWVGQFGGLDSNFCSIASRLEPDLTDTDLLVEALARLQAIDWILGDPAGPKHPKGYFDVERQVRWIEPLAVEPPDWDLDIETPLMEREDELWPRIRDRAMSLRARVRAQEEAYQGRVRARVQH